MQKSRRQKPVGALILTTESLPPCPLHRHSRGLKVHAPASRTWQLGGRGGEQASQHTHEPRCQLGPRRSFLLGSPLHCCCCGALLGSACCRRLLHQGLQPGCLGIIPLPFLGSLLGRCACCEPRRSLFTALLSCWWAACSTSCCLCCPAALPLLLLLLLLLLLRGLRGLVGDLLQAQCMGGGDSPVLLLTANPTQPLLALKRRAPGSAIPG